MSDLSTVIGRLSDIPIVDGKTEFTGRGRILGAPATALVGQQPTRPYDPIPNPPKAPPDPGLVAPVNTTPPAVTPSPATAGDLLTTTNGVWTNNPTSYWQTWLVNSAVVGTGMTYMTTTAGTVQCSVTATNDAGSTTQISNTVTVNA